MMVLEYILDSLGLYFSVAQTMINKDCNMVVFYKGEILITHICVPKRRFNMSYIGFF